VLDQLDAQTRATLERYGFDAATFERLREQVGSGALTAGGNAVTGRVEPPPAEALTPLPLPGDPGFEQAYERGAAAIRRGEVAMAVLNGGMATRFGGVVKGVVEALDGRSFLEWKLAEAARVARALGGTIPCLVMNSFATEDATRAFFAGLGERGADLPEPWFFNQFVSLRLNPDGSLFREADGTPSLYGPGHGDFHEALQRSGMLDRLRAAGVRYLMLSNVDNLGARVDPAVVGMHILAGTPMTVELSRKDRDTGGSPALVDGKLMVLEQFRFPKDFDQERIRVFNVNSFLFDVDALGADYPLTWFYVEKRAEGRQAVQLERLVGELSSFIPASYLVVPRTGPRGRFFPIKEPADLETSRPLLREMLSASLTDAAQPAAHRGEHS
jgi:UTP--glucose-1-phosphate uridylyltransferase